MNRGWILIALASLWLAGCEKARLDDEVRRLCAQDGGIKVYEAVQLSPEKFDKWGFVNFYQPAKGEYALGTEYKFQLDKYYYRKGNPEMWRSHYKVYRQTDGKLLGESVSYSRRGGDLPGPWHESSFGCPEERGDAPLLKRIFIESK